MKKSQQSAMMTAALAVAVIVCFDFDTSDLDTPHPYSSQKSLSEPALFGEGVISTPDDELNACFTPDGNTIYFTINAPVNRSTAHCTEDRRRCAR